MEQTNQESTSKITNPVRIGRIIAKMCSGHMQVLIRTKESTKLGIRAAFMQLDPIDNPLVIFDKISDLGLEKLKVGQLIKVEVIGMPSKVIFVTEVKAKGTEQISCSIPTSLVSMERRQNSRFRVVPAAMSFISFSVWQADKEDRGSPPFFDTYLNLAGWIPVVDISVGGVCIQSPFPSFLNHLETIEVDPKARLHLPMSPPMSFQAAIRWKRRIRNRIIEDENERYQSDFRLGIEFGELQDDQRNKIRQYLRQLSMAEAI